MAYISTEEVREIRKELKKEFPKYKFSVRKRQHAVSVSLLSSPLDFRSEFRDSTDKYSPVNQYYIDTNWSKPNAKVLKKILEIIKTAPAKAPNGEVWFDKSDIMTDYFYTAFYIEMSIGMFEKPYQIK